MKKQNNPLDPEMTTEAALYKLLADKVGAVDPNDVFYANEISQGKNVGKWACLIGGKKLTAAEASNLRAEVKMLDKTRIWKLFTETLRHEAQLRMFEKSKTIEDMFFGKALLHSIGVFETIIKAIQEAETDEKTLSTP